MAGRRMKPRHAPGWQLILCDLALILFLVTLSGLAGDNAESGLEGRATGDTDREAEFGIPAVAASQSLFRASSDGPDFQTWLAERPNDPRLTVTVFAEHSAEDYNRIWDEAEGLARTAKQNGFRVRVMISDSNVSDVYVSLAYDVPAEQPDVSD